MLIVILSESSTSNFYNDLKIYCGDPNPQTCADHGGRGRFNHYFVTRIEDDYEHSPAGDLLLG